MHLTELNKIFGIEGKVAFVQGKGGLTMIEVNTAHSNAIISTYGAHALSFKSKGAKELFWMSDASLFEQGKAIRGGIPVCFPWFGPHLTDKTKPQHGFARLNEWNVEEVTETAADSISITLSLTESESTLALWPHAFKATAKFIIGETFELYLKVINTGDQPFEYSDALHTYFNISNITAITIDGLQNESYYEGLGTELKKQTDEQLIFTGETNRRYVTHTGDALINDPGYQRKISVKKKGSGVSVIWNPAEATAKTMADIHTGGYKNFVCVEPANAYPGIDMVTLAPGAAHTIYTKIISQ